MRGKRIDTDSESLAEGAIAYRDLIGDAEFHLQRESAFSYACHACKRCCHYKASRVGSYEILRLSRYLGISTTEFIGRYTEAGGTVLRTRDENGACVFLNERAAASIPIDRSLAVFTPLPDGLTRTVMNRSDC
ncbi:MAG: YkgJ family cysteine cluster protein [Methylocella sp.]|nr:MAG: hypothetical protein DLM68_14230 [Hyphomicrobiales bacterium]